MQSPLSYQRSGAVTIARALDAARGRPSGFDYMRVVLSVVILLMHSFSVSYGPGIDAVAFWDSPLRPFARLLVPMFFALSGFLIAGSLERCPTLISFISLRVIRIYPALAVETAMSALILGPLLSIYPSNQYFSNPAFLAYLWNITGHVHYFLPGVFTANPFPLTVNNQLWTVPFELACYVTLSALVIAGVKQNRILAPLACAASIAVFIIARLIKNNGAFVPFEGAMSGPLLITCCLAGVTVYLYRAKIPFSRQIFALNAVAAIALLGPIPYGDCLAPLPIAYVTVYLGLLNPRRNFIIKNADLSYGVYLYAFVIQQAVSDLFVWSREWYINAIISLPLALAVAAVSWHFVEKPALRLRRHVATLENAFLSRRMTAVPNP